MDFSFCFGGTSQWIGARLFCFLYLSKEFRGECLSLDQNLKYSGLETLARRAEEGLQIDPSIHPSFLPFSYSSKWERHENISIELIELLPFFSPTVTKMRIEVKTVENSSISWLQSFHSNHLMLYMPGVCWHFVPTMANVNIQSLVSSVETLTKTECFPQRTLRCNLLHLIVTYCNSVTTEKLQ